MTDYRPDGRLVYTPPTHPREGFLGYVLRSSEANGYETPWHIFKLAGLAQSKMTSLTIPLGKLSHILGRPEDELERLPWRRCPEREQEAIPVSEEMQVTRFVALKHPRICPSCVDESGIVDSAWDLRIMLACPRHGIALVDHCPACHGRITWFRPGLNRCRCGHRLFADDGSMRFPQHALDLLQVVYDVAHGLPTNPTPSSGIPALALYGLGLRDLLRLLTRVGHLVCEGKSPGRGSKPYSRERLVRIAGFFDEWPRRFHQFLESTNANSSIAATGLARRFSAFYASIISTVSIERDKLLFIRSAFGQYTTKVDRRQHAHARYFMTTKEWHAMRKEGLTEPQIRAKALAPAGPPQFMSQAALAAHLGVATITLSRWATLGLFGLQKGQAVRSNRIIYAVPPTLPKKHISGSLHIRAAARRLGIPVSCLERLRRDGYLQVTRIGATTDQFHEDDLSSLEAMLLDRAPILLEAKPDGHMTLTEYFRLKLKGVENKYQLIQGILDGTCLAVGRLGPRVGDIIVSDESVCSLRTELEQRTGWVTARIAARLLQCLISTVIRLVVDGHLEGQITGRFCKVTTESLERFGAKFESCTTIATRWGTTVRRVKAVLAARGVVLLDVPVKKGSAVSLQTFCRRDDLASHEIGKSEFDRRV